jgi:hypothetical protein
LNQSQWKKADIEELTDDQDITQINPEHPKESGI